MCYRITQFLLLALALVTALVIFLPWQNLPVLNTDGATRLLATKIILMPLPVFCLLGAIGCASKRRRRLRV